jgi:DNA-binding transcriptional LysR family regulator
MELRHLRYFVALAERLNFTAAAKFLGIRQPPLSIQIRKLEAEVGGSLFSRAGRRVRLTPLGATLLDEARKLLAQASHAEERIHDFAAGREGRIRVACDYGARSERICRRLRKFIRKHRGVRVSVEEIHATEYETFGAFDALITQCFDLPADAVPLERSQPHVALSPKHRLVEHETIEFPDLIGECLLLAPFETRGTLERRVSEIVEGQKLAVSELAVFPHFADRLWQVSLGLGIAFCAESDRPTFDAIRRPLGGVPEILMVARPNPASCSAALPALLESIRE